MIVSPATRDSPRSRPTKPPAGPSIRTVALRPDQSLKDPFSTSQLGGGSSPDKGVMCAPLNRTGGRGPGGRDRDWAGDLSILECPVLSRFLAANIYNPSHRISDSHPGRPTGVTRPSGSRPHTVTRRAASQRCRTAATTRLQGDGAITMILNAIMRRAVNGIERVTVFPSQFSDSSSEPLARAVA